MDAPAAIPDGGVPPGNFTRLSTLTRTKSHTTPPGPTITEFSYSGTELDAVAQAGNYYDWIVDRFAPFLGKSIIEAGAGIGTVSKLLLERADPDYLCLVEPAQNNIPVLRKQFAHDERVSLHYGYLEDEASWRPADSVVAVNVLEHVEHDSAFVGAAYERLKPGGYLLLLVPALPFIYGSLDRAFDHYRRYTRSSLRPLVTNAGFELRTLRYMNFLGVAAWFASGRIMHRRTLGLAQVRFYDRFVIPPVRLLESIFPPPLGQSLLVVARKPE